MRPPVPTLQEKIEQSATIASALDVGMRRRCEHCRWYRAKTQYEKVCHQPFVDQTQMSNYGKVIHRDIDAVQARNSEYLCGPTGELFEAATRWELATGIYAEKTFISAFFGIIATGIVITELVFGAPWWVALLTTLVGGAVALGAWFEE